ncbi:hypothetical protein CCACVL1_01253, partial [Corchorus capsularis]
MFISHKYPHPGFFGIHHSGYHNFHE